MAHASFDPTHPSEQRAAFIGRVQEQRQFLVVLQGLLTHHRRWVEAAAGLGPNFDPRQGPTDESYASIFLLHGIGGIGKSWLTRHCLTLAREMPVEPPILTLYDDISISPPVLEPAHLLDRLHDNLVRAGYEARVAPYRQAKADLPPIIERVSRYQFENRDQWDTMLQTAAGLVARSRPEVGYHAFTDTSLAHTHASGAEVQGQDAPTLAKAYDLLLEKMQAEGKITPAEITLFRNPPAAQAIHLIETLYQIAAERPIILSLDNLEIAVPLEPFIRDCLVLPCDRAPIIWMLTGRYNLADERMVEINQEERLYKGYRDILGHNPPVVWDMSIFGDADLRDYLEIEAERRRIDLLINDELIEAIKATSSGVPLVVEMVSDALFAMDRDKFLSDFALDERGLLPKERLDHITERFLRYCLTNTDDLERVQAMALLLKGADEAALTALWNLPPDRSVGALLTSLRSRYAFVMPDGLHDAVYEFVRRQLRTGWYNSEVRPRLSSRAVRHYRPLWERLDQSFDDPARRIRHPQWQRTTRALVNALLWDTPDEAVLFLLPRFVEGLGFDRSFSNGLLRQAEEFLGDDISIFSRDYVTLLHRLRVGMQDIDWTVDEPGRAIGSMLEALLDAPGLTPLHLSILHLLHGHWLVENRQYEAGLAAYLQADAHRPEDALDLRKQLGNAFYELSSRLLWPDTLTETVASEAGRQAAQRAVDYDPANGSAWFNLGSALDHLGQVEAAVPAYERAVELEPRPRHYNSLGEAYDALERDDEAIAAYQKAVELAPTYPWPYHSLGQIYAQHGDYPQALSYYQLAIDHHQNDRERAISWDSFGDAQMALENYDEAVSAYKWATVLSPKYAPPWYGLGNAYSSQEQYPAAIEAYQKAIALDPDFPLAYHQLGVMYARQSRYSEAITQYRHAIGRHTSDAASAASWHDLGDIYRAQERQPDALEAYRRAIRLDPQRANSWNSSGEIYLELGNTEAAFEAFSRTIELDPDFTAAWDSLGDIHTAAGRDDEAIAAYQRVIELAPDDPWAYNSLGYIYGRQKAYEPALDFYGQAVERFDQAEQLASAWNNIGDICLTLGRLDEAATAYERAIRLNPALAWPYHNLGTIHTLRKIYQPAEPLYRQALDRHTRDEDRAMSWQRLGDVYRHLRENPSAIAAYRQAAALGASNSDLWVYRGDVAFKLGLHEEADLAYQRAIDLDDADPRPYYGLAIMSDRRDAYESAVTQYRQAIERYRDNRLKGHAWTKLGDTYLILNKIEQAIDAYRRAIQLAPRRSEAYYSLGSIHEQRGEYQSALTLYQGAVKRTENTSVLARTWNGIGNSYLALNQPDEAVKAYHQAGELDPQLAAPWLSLGDIYRSQNQPALAIDCYEQAFELAPADPRPIYGLGLIHAGQAKPELAATYFEQALERYQAEAAALQIQAEAWTQLGHSRQALGWNEAAIDAYRQAIELAPETVAAWANLGDIYAAQANHAEAVTAYRQAVELDPTLADAWHNLGGVYLTLEQYPDAVEAYQQAVKHNPVDADAYFNLGLIHETLKQHQPSIDNYEQAVQYYPPSAGAQIGLAWRGIGQAQQALEREPQAIDAYHQAITHHPADPWSHHYLGRIYFRRQQYELAEPLLRQALDRYPADSAYDVNRANDWNMLGDIYQAAGRPGDAIEAYRQASRLDPTLAQPQYSLGGVFRSQANFEAAKAAYGKAIELDPARPEPYYELGLVHQTLQQYGSAQAQFEQAIERQSDRQAQAVAWNSLGDVYRSQQQYDQAIEAYQQATHLDPTLARPWNSLGEVYEIQNRTSGLAEAYRRAIELDPALAEPYHHLGELSRRQGALDQAVAYYRQALERYPATPDYPPNRAASWIGLGNIYRDRQQDNDAIAAYQQAIYFNPDDGWPYHNLGFIYNKQWAYPQAIDFYRQAIERFEDDAAQAIAWNNLGNVYSNLNRPDEAIAAYRQAIDLDSTYGLPWHSLGRMHTERKQYGEAADAYKQAIQRSPDYLPAWSNLGDVYRQMGRPDEAIAAYEQAIKIDPTYAWPYHNLGLLHEERADYESAINAYQQAIEHHTDQAQKAILWDRLGNVYRLRNEPQPAIEAYQEAAGFDPRYAAPWYSLGNVYAMLAQDQEAIAAYRRAIELNPAEAWPYHHLALVYENRQAYPPAAALYRQAIDRHRTDSDRAVSWDSLGNVYSSWGQYPQAIQAFEEAVRLNPQFALPWNSLGDVYSAVGDYPKAIEAYRQAIALDPNYAWSYNNLGLVYEKIREYDLAIATYRQVLDRQTEAQDRAVSWNSLGDVYLALNREKEAVTAYEQAIALDPDYVWPYNSLGGIYEKRGQYDYAYALYQQATRRHRQQSMAL